MKMLQRSKLASAILAATTGLSVLAVSNNADARDIEEELQDEVLVYPYYTVRDGWTTLANVSNTTPYTLVVKVRYRESFNSRDVLDFNLVLSPFDVWTGWVSEGPNGPRLHTRDASCTSPIFQDAGNGSRYADFSNLGYQQDGGPTDIDRAREGHFEFITMGEFFPGSEDKKWSESDSASPGECFEGDPDNDCATNQTGSTISWSEGDPMYPTAYYAKHVDGQPRDCSIVDSRFVATASPFDIEDIVDNDGFDDYLPLSRDGNPLAEWDAELNHAYWPWYSEPDGCGDCRRDEAGDPLKGNFGLVNVAQGIAAGGIPYANNSGCNFDNEDMITAQQFPWFLEPTLYSYSCDLWEWDRRFSNRLAVAAMNNEWSSNPNTGAATDWVVTFPTKEFHTDISETDIYAGANPVRLIEEGDCNFDGDAANQWYCNIYSDIDPAAADTFEDAFVKAGGLYFNVFDEGPDGLQKEGFEEVFDGQSCDTVTYNLWDREETGVEGGGTSISPAPPQPTDSLCYETNVLAFQDESALGSDLAVQVDTSVLPSGASEGLLKLQVSQNCSFNNWGIDGDFCKADELPAIGFMFKRRDFGDPTRNFGVLSEHGYDD